MAQLYNRCEVKQEVGLGDLHEINKIQNKSIIFDESSGTWGSNLLVFSQLFQYFMMKMKVPRVCVCACARVYVYVCLIMGNVFLFLNNQEVRTCYLFFNNPGKCAV